MIHILPNTAPLELLLEARRKRQEEDAKAAEAARRHEALTMLIGPGIAACVPKFVIGQTPGPELVRESQETRRG